MKSLAMSRRSRVMSGVFVACIAFAVHGATNVFDDAVFWFRGGKDNGGDGFMRQQGEFFDDLHANEPTHDNHKMGVMTYNSPSQADEFKNNAVFCTENVVFPALGEQIAKSVPVLRLSNNMVEFNNRNYYWPQFVKPYGVFNNNHISSEYTIVSRLRLDDDGRARTQCVFKVGYNATNGQGMWLGFSEMNKTTKTKHITGRCTPSSNDSDASFSFDNFHIPTNTWFDMAVVVGNGKLRVGVTVSKAYQDNPTIFFAETDMLTSSSSSTEADYRLFCETGQNAQQYVVANIDQTCFIGSVQQLAIWGRALDDQEVMAAFGMPRPAIFRTGFDNGASGEFGGTRTGSTQTIDGLGSWQNVANTMKVGDTWTVNFNALRDEANLAQIFSIKSLPGSSAAQIEVELNGTSLGEGRVAADTRAFWPVATNIVRAGENELVIRCKEGGARGFLMDAMELGGSLGVGKMTGSSTDDGRVDPELIKTGVPSAADPNPQHWPTNLVPSTGIKDLHFRVWVDPDVADKASFTLKTAAKCDASSSSEKFFLYVNRAKKGEIPANASWKQLSLSLKAGDLLGGWNDIDFYSTDARRWEFGYFRFETVLPSPFGFSTPPGLAVSIR